MKLASGAVEKEGVTITFTRPVLSEVQADPQAKTGRVIYFDESDERRSAAFQKSLTPKPCFNEPATLPRARTDTATD